MSTYVVNFGPAKTGLATVGYRIVSDAGVLGSRVTSGVYEIGGGAYGVNYTHSASDGSIRWDTGEGTPAYAVEDIQRLHEIQTQVDENSTTISDIKDTVDANLDAAVSTRATPADVSGSTGDVAADVWSYAQRVLTDGTITTVAPFQTGHLTIIRGQSYLNADANAITITKANGATWPSDIASLPWTISVKFEPSARLLNDMTAAVNGPSSSTISGTVINASSVRFDLTKAQTDTFTLNTVNKTSGNAHSYNYAVIATTGSKEIALEIGTATIVDDIVTS